VSESAASPKTVALLTAITALGSISVSIYLPSLPAIAKDFGTSGDSAKLTLTAFLFLFAAAQLAYGPLSDRFGRKRPILVGIGIYILGSLACAASGSLQWLVAARVLQAIGASAGPALGRAVIRDLFGGPRLTSALAVVAAAVALSPMLGPFAGGLIAQAAGWRAIFVLLTVLAVFLLAWTGLALPETKPGPSVNPTKGPLQNYKTLLLDKEYIAAVGCAGFLTAGNYAWNAAAPFVLAERYRVTPALYGTLGLLVGGGYVLGTLVAMRLAKRISADKLVYAGLSLSVLAGIALSVTGSLWKESVPLFVIVSIFTLGMGIVLPAAAACALSRHPEAAGAAAGLLGAVQIFIGALGSSVIGLFHVTTPTPIGETMLVCGALALFSGYIALFPFRDKLVQVQASHA
jgi:DHA1 family bicyclomycin/chloramphenicol resistance-like MFS transporter